MLISVNNLTKSFGDRTLFDGLSFFVDKNERLAIVGRNGCGKTTLLKLLIGNEEYDDGIINIDDVKISYLKQSTNEYTDTLSGGEKARENLSKIFDDKPSIMILDEPTNHLDMEGINWLETNLKSFKGALIFVSHDRYLIDNVATKVLDLNTRPYKLYKGNYTDYQNQKNLIVRSLERENKKYEEKVAHERAVIDKLKSFNRQKSIKRAESREKMLNKLEGPKEFEDSKTNINMTLSPSFESGKDVCLLSEVSKSFENKLLFKDCSFDIRKGEHVGLIGGNGTGKTTIFKILLGIENVDTGLIKIGTNVSIAYYDQKLNLLDESKNIYDEISDEHLYMTETEVRNTLAAFSFFDNDVYKKISDLSGGEKGRLTLCKLMLSNANFLLLDEPTNHLDMESKEVLEKALNNYTGTVLFISHDRYFLNKCADRILDLSNNTLKNYLGNYDDYYEKKMDLIERGLLKEENDTRISPVKTVNENRLAWEEEKKEKAKREKQKRDEEKLIKDIELIENRIKTIDEELLNEDISTDFVKLNELVESKTSLEEQLFALYEKLD